jgi:hypothetical protein
MLFVSLLFLTAGCDRLEELQPLVLDLIGGGATPSAPLPDYIVEAVKEVPDQVVNASPVQLRMEAAEILRILSTSHPSQDLTDVETRILEDVNLFLDESRLEDSSVLQRHVDVANRLLKLASQKNLKPEIQDAYLQALKTLLLSDYQVVALSASDAEVVVKSARVAGDVISDVGVQAAESELERTRELMVALDGAWRRGDVRGGINLLVPAWESSAAVRSVWGLRYEGDYEEDGVIELFELSLGSSPFSTDSDNDGLSDYFEIIVMGHQTMPGLADTDDDGVMDGDEDLDLDGVSNIMERDLGTDPMKLDSDGDGISDMALVLGENMGSITGDSDGDGLSDESEERMGTDLFHVDTDRDGIPDGQEYHLQIIALDDIGLSIDILGMGDHTQSISVEHMVGAPGFAGNFGQVGDFVIISTELPFQLATIHLTYDETLVPAGDELNLRLFLYDEELGQMVMLESPSVDMEANQISGGTTQLGPIGVLYLPIWLAVNPQQ